MSKRQTYEVLFTIVLQVQADDRRQAHNEAVTQFGDDLGGDIIPADFAVKTGTPLIDPTLFDS